ncbi:baseplate assembly protein [Acinetobacter sp. ANC 4635]|uniref:baseplate assembly protein n=1 Tax=Acinetobacter sp. ANC 4635 TaxID=2529846 RepID=UPI001039B9C2|nr:baseplate assembly protein [Acinetobacter sp. ANC 4635]TCB32176.1 baseplate assembly protein [Acinetobacter sp. ANC 4635]
MMQMINALNMHAAHAQKSGFSGTRSGLVTAYDPSTYSVKVQLQPTGEETGWIPLETPWVGNGWGFAAGPMIGAVIKVDFDSGQIGVGMASGQFYNDEDRCPAPPSGELWAIHQSGSMLKFKNDGTVEVTAAKEIIHTAPKHTFHGPVAMDQTLQVTQQITGQGGVNVSGGSGMAITGGNITHNGKNIGATHAHSGVQTGGGNTGAPV